MKEIALGDSTTLAELSDLLGVSVTVIVKTAFTALGLMATMHEPLSFEQASAIASAFGFTARRRP